MAEYTLVIGNYNYSSWSMRPFLVLRYVGADLKIVRVPLYMPDSQEKIRQYSPSGLVPVLLHDRRHLWDSLAIAEYLNDRFPEAKLWPDDIDARAIARSVSAEMHSGFSTLRSVMPMNIRRKGSPPVLTPALNRDLQRVRAVWRFCRDRYGAGGPFLFGRFSIADAMYAPVVTRFESYGLPVGPIERKYMDDMLSFPPLKEWMDAARAEKEIIQKYEQ